MGAADDRRWERLQAALAAEIDGNTPKVASTRTLFGIKSHVEEVIDRVVDEENERTAHLRDLGVRDDGK